MNLSKLTRGFKWYLEIKVINLMSYFFSNNVILWQENEKSHPTVEIFFDSLLHDLHNCTFAFAMLSIKMLFFSEYNCQ